MSGQNESAPVVIVGAGLVGALLAIFLARRGFKVDLYERRADMRKEAISAGRSINLAVSTRGLYALKHVGLEQEILKQAIPMRGRMIHSVAGELNFQPYGKDDTEYINSISRAGLNKTLLTMAEQTGSVRVFFNEKALSADLDSNVLWFHNEETGDSHKVEAEMIFGTDGSASVIRDDIINRTGKDCSESYLDYGYKELVIPPGDKDTFKLEKNALHIWPRGTYMLIALPNFDASFTCTLFLPFKGDPSFDSLITDDAVAKFFNQHFSDAVPLIPDLVKTFFHNPTGHMVTVKCRPWYFEDKALLVGDAAHAIVPFFGQGMNAGFEDLTVLDICMDKLLRQGNFSWKTLFAQFFQERKNNTDAIADMAVENFTEMRDKVADPRFQLEKAVEKILQKEFPGEYLSRYSLVTFSNAPYSLALEAGILINDLLSELCHDLKKPEDVDLKKAATLIHNKLTPLLKQHEHELAVR